MQTINSNTPFFEFTPQKWSSFAHHKEKLHLTQEDLSRCVAFNDRLSLDDVKNIYLPLSRLIYLYFRSRHDRSEVIEQFLGKSLEKSPFIISISGSVSVGKTTTAKLLKELLSSWPSKPKVDLITTDGYLLPNAELEKRGILDKKGFPISYDVHRLMQFLFDVKDCKENLKVPVYSHLNYDVLENEFITINQPDILIIEGVNVLQNGADYPEIRNKVFISDFIDFSIFVDAIEEHLIKWYIDRFLKLRESTFNDPKSYFHRYASMPEGQAIALANVIWQGVNHQNLVENILPCKNRANIILHKGHNHKIEKIFLRK